MSKPANSEKISEELAVGIEQIEIPKSAEDQQSAGNSNDNDQIGNNQGIGLVPALPPTVPSRPALALRPTDSQTNHLTLAIKLRTKKIGKYD